MTVFAKLKLVASKKERNVSPVVARRNKLAGKIDEQLLFATAQRDGQIYAPKRLKNVIDKATGERKQLKQQSVLKNGTGRTVQAKSICLFATEAKHWNWLKARTLSN
mgnify:CR=1 FL=1